MDQDLTVRLEKGYRRYVRIRRTGSPFTWISSGLSGRWRYALSGKGWSFSRTMRWLVIGEWAITRVVTLGMWQPAQSFCGVACTRFCKSREQLLSAWHFRHLFL